MTIADILDKAADLIEPKGAWKQGGYGFGGTPTCMGGAINLAAGRKSFETPEDDPTILFVASILDRPIAWWNDARDRTQGEAVAKLREAAAKAREQSS